MPLSRDILDYHFNLASDIPLPDGVEWLYPYDDTETRRCMTLFYEKYYNDDQPRSLVLGINPGRFGAGITGVPFTDPIRLSEECHIPNEFHKRQELSSVFVYEIVAAMGGPEAFYGAIYISSICPLGFVKDGKNFNYYDARELAEAVRPFIVDHIKAQIALGIRTDVVFSMGQGKNFKYLTDLNQQHGFFNEVVPLPHPRWVMQYKLKSKQVYLDQYVAALRKALEQ